MANSKYLRQNKEQHKPKNLKSKQDDKNIYQAMQQCIQYLKQKLALLMQEEYDFEFKKKIFFSEMINTIKDSGIRKDFDMQYKRHLIQPDGGIIWLIKKSDKSYKKPVLIAEVKRQGTNDQRVKEGKSKQAQGNAIERLGKNLTGIKAMFNHLSSTPFVCFGWGCDFAQGSSILARVSMLNEFYKLNKIYVQKKDGGADYNDYSPVSMFFREKQWKTSEMLKILKEIAETQARQYLT